MSFQDFGGNFTVCLIFTTCNTVIICKYIEDQGYLRRTWVKPLTITSTLLYRIQTRNVQKKSWVRTFCRVDFRDNLEILEYNLCINCVLWTEIEYFYLLTVSTMIVTIIINIEDPLRTTNYTEIFQFSDI